MVQQKSPSSSDAESLDGLSTAHFKRSKRPTESLDSDAPAGPPRPSPGAFFDGYEILEQLGEGGMGTVYKARSGGRLFALKVLLHSSPDFLARFKQEAAIIGQINHPHIVRLHSFPADAPWPYIVVDFVEGSTLTEFMSERASFSLQEAVTLLRPIADALEQIHRQGIFHRDIKPANILIRRKDSSPVLTDFGLAKVAHLDSLTKTGEVLGTPYYMAPEQFTGKKCQAQTDVWALSLVLYEMISGGKRPFKSHSPAAYAHSVLFNEPTLPTKHKPELAEEIDLIFSKALQKTPKRRYSSAPEFIDDCQRVLDKQPPLARRPNVLQRLQDTLITRFGKKGLAFGLGVFFAALLGALYLFNALMEQQSIQNQLEKESIPQLLSVIESYKTQRASLNSDIIRHLHKPNNSLPCCEKAKKLQASITELKENFASYQAQKIRLPELKKRQATLEQVEENGRALALIHHGPQAREQRPLPKRHRSFYQALSRALMQDYEGARSLFEEVPDAPRELSSAFQFAKALCAYRCGQFQEASKLFESLKNQGLERETVDEHLLESSLQMSVAQFYKAPALRDEYSKSLASALKNAPSNARERVLARWGQLVQERFHPRNKRLSNKSREQIYLAYRAFNHHYPELPSLKMTKSDWEQCVKSAKKRENPARVLFYYYQLQKLDPQVAIPPSFEFAINEKGQFDLFKLRNQLSVLFFLKRKTPLELFEYNYEASFHGLYLDLFDQGDIRKTIQSLDVIEKELQRNPMDPLLRLWKLLKDKDGVLNKSPQRYYSQFIAPLEYPQKHPQLIKPFRALALTTKVERIILWEKLKTTKANKALQDQCFKDLEQALKWHHPFPEIVYWHRKDLRLWTRSSQSEVRAVLPDIFEDLKQYRFLSQERLRRASAKSLHVGRPPGFPLTWISKALVESKLAYDHQFRGLLFHYLDQDRDAERELTKSCLVLGEEKSWRTLLQLLKKSKNQSVIQRLQSHLKDVLASKLDPPDRVFFSKVYRKLQSLNNNK